MGRPVPPDLTRALEGEAVRPVLEEVLRGREGPDRRVSAVEVEPVRRRTVRYVVHLEGAGTRRLIGKVYESAEAGRHAYELLRRLEDAGFGRADSPRVQVPRALGFSPEPAVLLMEEVGGTSLLRLARKGLAGAREGRAFARALLELHGSPPEVAAPFTLDDHLRVRCAGLVEPLTRELPELADGVERVLDAARQVEAGLATRTLCHGDYHPGQVHVDHADTWILDLDALHAGDPAYDVALALAALERLDEHAPGSHRGAFREAFLATYLARTAADDLYARVPVSRALVHLKRACKRFRWQDEPAWRDAVRREIRRAVASLAEPPGDARSGGNGRARGGRARSGREVLHPTPPAPVRATSVAADRGRPAGLRIAYLTSDFGVPVLGRKGASVHVRRLVAALAARGHEVTVITPAPGEGTEKDGLGARVVHVPLEDVPRTVYDELKKEAIAADTRLAKDLRNVLYSLALETRALGLLEELRPDVLYERYTLFGTAGRALAARLGLPHLLEVNAPLVEEQREQRGLSLPNVAVALQRAVLSAADEVLVVSRWLEGYVREHGADPRRTTVLPNAADPELFRPLAGPSAVRRRLGWEERFVLAFVGAMKPWQGVPTLVDALEELGGASSPFRLLLVGDGPALADVRQRVHERGLDDAVHLAGAVPHREVPDWLGAADVALVPFTETAAPYFSPVKLFECMAMGLPVVAARLGQTEEVLTDGLTGYLYSPSRRGQLAARIAWIAGNRRAAATVGARARARVLERHTWAHNAARVEELALRTLQRRERRPVQVLA